ncbi:MAG TPA: hypothetical protein VM096_00560 [Vicinamibacterales bacterium]|nr:hypothetical protein [Vicinamibacterales bacterium]
MGRFLLLLALFVVIARTFWRFVDAVVRGASSPPPFDSAQARPQGGRRPGAAAAVKMSQCPVCGTYVVPGKAISIVSGGSPIYFDSDKCRAEYQSR